ncbi:MAG: glycosyltransferase family 4 protein [bacterium]
MVLSNPFKPDYRVFKEANSLVRHGYRVTIIAWDRNCRYPAYEVIDNIKIERIAVKADYGSGILKLNAMIQFWLEAIKRIKSKNASIVHCHDLDTLIVGFFCRVFCRVKIVYDSHENFPAMAQMSSPNIIIFMMKKFEDFLLHFVDSIIVANSSLGGEFKLKTKLPVTVIGNWHHRQKLDNSKIQALRKKYTKESKILITYIGSLDLSRSIIPMIEAVKLEPTIRFLICGNGTQRNAIIDAISNANNVDYIGEIPLAMVPYFTAASDVIYYVMNETSPMANYNAPNSLGFALAVGKPLIASDNGELGKVVRSADCGFLVRDNKIGTLRAVIQSLLVDNKLAELSENALDAGNRLYNWAKMEERLISVYNNLKNR